MREPREIFVTFLIVHGVLGYFVSILYFTLFFLTRPPLFIFNVHAFSLNACTLRRMHVQESFFLYTEGLIED